MSNEGSATLERVESLLALGRAEEAARTAEDALAHAPEDPFLLAALARARLEFAPDEAIGPARRAVHLAPAHPRVHLVLVRTLWRTGALRDAVAEVDRLIAQAPFMPEAHASRAGIIVENATMSGRRKAAAKYVDDARTSAERAVALAPDWPSGHVMAGRVALVGGNWLKARSHAKEALRLDPELAAAHELLGASAHASGDLNSAGDHFVRAGRLDPDQSTVDRLRSLRRPLGWGALIGFWVLYRVAVVSTRAANPPTWFWAVFGLGVVATVGGVRWWIRRRARDELSAEARQVLEVDRSMRRRKR